MSLEHRDPPGQWRRPVGIVMSIVIVAGLAGLIASRLQTRSPQQDANRLLLNEVRSQATPVTMSTATYGSLTRTLALNGRIESPHSADVPAQSPGLVEAVYVSEGDHVTAGQVLAQLNTSQTSVQVSQAQQQLQAVETSYSRAIAARTLAYKQASGDVAQARISVAQAETGLAKARAGAGPAAIDRASATARQAHSAAAQAADALRRTQFLYEHGVDPLAQLQDARAQSTQAAAAAAAADAAVQEASQGATPEDRQLAAEKITEARQQLAQAIDSQKTRDQIADSDVAAALSQVRASQDQLHLAQLQLAALQVISPLSGVVTAVHIHPGESAMPGAGLFSITSLGNVYVQTSVSDTEKLQLAIGQPAQVKVDAAPGRSFIGKVVSIVPVVNPGATGFQVRVDIQPAGVNIPPGAYATCVAQTAFVQHALIIPSSAVLLDSTGSITGKSGGQYVYLVGRSGDAVTQIITTGLTTASQSQVLSGLQPGQQVVNTGAELLTPGAAVSIQPGPR